MDAQGTPADGRGAEPIRAVLLDALGTIVGLHPPVPRLLAALESRGIACDPRAAGHAVLGEMAHYRAVHHRAGTAAGLAAVRAECAGVMRDALVAGGADGAAGLGAEDLEALLRESFVFFAYPEAAAVLGALRERGLRLVVCSNWDLSLDAVLAETGLDRLLDGAAISAVEGTAKPDGGLFARALALAGAVAPGAALHVGDSVEADVMGARAAGLRPVLVRRDGDEVRSHEPDAPEPPADVPVIADLDGLLALV